jgi:DNA-binding HxlR family transcriptional regulator
MLVMEKIVHRTTLKEQPSDHEYWLTQPVSERLAAVEQLRLEAFPLSNPDNHAKHRLQRVYRVTQLRAG